MWEKAEAGGTGQWSGIGVSGKRSQEDPDTCVIPWGDYPERMFFLTRRESFVIILVMLALTAGAGIRHWRTLSRIPGEAGRTSHAHR